MAYESFVLEDHKKWQSEIKSELEAIQKEIDSKEERLRVIKNRIYVIKESQNELGINAERRKKHWKLYGEPLELEYEKLEEEISLETNNELAEKKSSLNAINTILNQLIIANS